MIFEMDSLLLYPTGSLSCARVVILHQKVKYLSGIADIGLARFYFLLDNFDSSLDVLLFIVGEVSRISTEVLHSLKIAYGRIAMVIGGLGCQPF
jgi:hypothetical protein